MTDTTVFTGDNPTEQQPTQQEQDLSSALVGEGKKYKDVNDLAKAYMSADGFIETLKKENHELRSQTNTSATLDTILERLQQQQSTVQADQPKNEESPLSVSELQKLVEQTVSGMEGQKARQQNIAKADKMLKDKFGDKAVEVYKAKATTDQLNSVYMELASVDPDQFVALFTNNPVISNTVDEGGSRNNVSYQGENRQAQVGTKEYYDNIRRTTPAKYYSQDFQLQMDKTVRSNPQLYYGNR